MSMRKHCERGPLIIIFYLSTAELWIAVIFMTGLFSCNGATNNDTQRDENLIKYYAKNRNYKYYFVLVNRELVLKLLTRFFPWGIMNF